MPNVADIIPKLHRLVTQRTQEQLLTPIPPATPLPLLRCLAVRMSSEDLQNILDTAPNLRELTTSSNAPSFRLASQSLLSLELAAAGIIWFDIDVFLAILNNCPQLSHLKIPVRDRSNYKCAPMTFPHLRSLIFSQTYGESVLEFVTLPNLVRLGGL